MSDTFIEDKEKLEEDFLGFLHESQYPDDSIFRGPSFQIDEATKRRVNFPKLFKKDGLDDECFPCYVDLAILDLESQEYAALIEFRLRLDEQVESEMSEFFRAILKSLDVKPPVFLVVPQGSSCFRIYQLRENGIWKEVPQKSFPHYQTLVAGHAAEKKATRDVKLGKALDRFTTTCYLVAGIIALIVISSIGGLNALTVSQMTLLILVASLAVAPHAIRFRLSMAGSKPRILKFR
jgi:hypothetical protein